jgi:hypothetical protein
MIVAKEGEFKLIDTVKVPTWPGSLSEKARRDYCLYSS